MAETTNIPGTGHHGDGQTRRDFMVLTATALSAVGAASVVWPFISSMNPAADTLAMSSTEVDLTPVAGLADKRTHDRLTHGVRID